VNPLRLYLVGTGSWFLSFGIQSVMFAWLVTMVLRESPEMVGVAQMTMLIPTMLFILVGGSLADQFGARRVVLIAQSVAALAPLLLLVVVTRGALTFAAMLVYAVIMGSAQAFVTPARDGLLNQVATSSIQRTVVQVSMIQFGVQMAGFLIASYAENIGAELILGVQVMIILAGVFAFRAIDLPSVTSTRVHDHLIRDLLHSVREGYATVAASPPMRIIALQNCVMGVCFMGSYIVTLPLLLREVFDGSSSDLGMLNAANSLGLVTTIIILMRFGDIRRQGRALVLSQVIGAAVLALGGTGVSFPTLAALVFCWGMCGGVAMSMARTIMQEQAPEHQRGRVMSFYSFSFMGSGPIGALVCGFLVNALGPELALITASTALLVIMLIVAATSQLWHITSDHHLETLAS
jgi:MFS family permease